MGYGIPPDKLIITVAQTGAITTKKSNPNVPEQPEEIADSAYACFNEGAAICHIHARDTSGENTAEISIFEDIHDRIREKCNIVLGMRYQGAEPAIPATFFSMVQNLPADSIFNCTGVGPAQISLGTISMVLGGCVRVGLEDNIYFRKGELARSNAQLVARAVRIARELGKEPATPEEARDFLGLTGAAS